MLDGLINPLTIGIAIIVIVVLALLFSITRLYVIVPTDKAAIISGGRTKARVVHGAGFFRVPIVQQYKLISLQTIPVNLEVKNVYSKNNVPVSVDATAQVRIPGEEEAIFTAAERFQSTSQAELHALIKDGLEGIMRAIIATMTIEELNGQRDVFKQNILDQAVSAFNEIGHKVEIVTIKTISDENGYLRALGAQRIAEVKRDAEIAEAENSRESREKVAKSNQQAALAEAESKALTAQAERDRDIAIEQANAAVEAQRATTEQAGPLAKARAAREVAIAEQQTAAAREEAGIEVEVRRTARAEQAAKADTIVPAEARRQAKIADAEGERQAIILKAEADAQSKISNGSAEAQARTQNATATQAELTAQAEGRKAQLSAEAAGLREMAEAFMLSPEAAQLQMVPTILEHYVNAVGEASKPLGAIDNISIIGGGNSEGGLFGGLQSSMPMILANVAAVLKQQGIDISQFVGGSKNPATAPVDSQSPATTLVTSPNGTEHKE
jgi:flotillin